uniref:Uncharacterized protein n=1 Tax=Lactuca sativa TaxID=4236 RepID=A0A9R1UP12_LACSA|nr:hypothetical protein LSAT_V11C800415450 [Lactuca sativa]
MSIVIYTPPKNYRDAYEDVDEKFSNVVSPYNDNILPQGKGQTLILVFCRERILSSILFEDACNTLCLALECSKKDIYFHKR